jgi:hypothetical protein
MFRELVTGLVIVFMAGSVILSSIFRSTRAAKPQLAADIGNTVSTTEKQDNPPVRESGSTCLLYYVYMAIDRIAGKMKVNEMQKMWRRR